MTIIPFNDNWSYRHPAGPFAGAMGAPELMGPVYLPHDALRDATRSEAAPAKGATAYYPSAAYTYLKEFAVPSDWANKIVRLEIQGAFRRAQVFVNDEFAGNRADGYARFFVDLTPFLVVGERNVIRVEVRAGEDSRWYSGAGLHRPVFLHIDGPVHIAPDGIAVRTIRVEDDQAVVEVETLVVNATLQTHTLRVRTEISDNLFDVVERDETPVTLAPGETTRVRQNFYVRDPRLWSDKSPELYTARVELVGYGCDVSASFGIRSVTVDPTKGLRINGEPVLLRGACVHHDNGPLGAAATSRAEERRVELLKAAGFNAIRAAHNPLSVAMLDACDRLGMFVIDEAFDMWTRFKTPYDYAADFPQWWESDLDAMVAKDRNHPSVIMYSIGNEIAEVGTVHGARWARRLADHVRSLDQTRPVTNGVNALLAVLDEMPQIVAGLGGLNAAMAGGGLINAVSNSSTASARLEESSAVLDVLGLNYGDSRYESDAEAFPHRVIVGSETFPSQIGNLWPQVLANPNVIGDFTWAGWDYLGEVGIGSTMYADDESSSGQLEREFPYLTAWCGDLDITGWRRPVSYYRELVFGLRSEPYIAVRRPKHYGSDIVSPSPWAWSDSVSSWTWDGYENNPATVEIYANAELVELYLEGTHLGTAQVGIELPMLATLDVDYHPGKLVAVAFADGKEVGRTSLSTAGKAMLTARADRRTLKAIGDDLSFVSIELRDDEGLLVQNTDRVVTVTVEGAGALVGMCSANPKTQERFNSSSWTTFDGRALAVIRPESSGLITVTVASPGQADVVLVLEAI